MTTNLVISGGPLHDFQASTAALVEILAAEGVTSTVPAHPTAALELLADPARSWDLVTVNALLWDMSGARYDHLREAYAFSHSPRHAEALHRHVHAGGGLLACHAAVICFDGDERWTSMLGARWCWASSSHPPQGSVRISVTPDGHAHPVTAGLVDFDIVDEVYGFLDRSPALVPLLTSEHGGTDHPLLWAHSIGAGQVVVDLLGHDAASFRCAEHAEVVGRAARWLQNRLASSPTRRASGGAP
jgi:type 1 glutamine amidotransferase